MTLTGLVRKNLLRRKLRLVLLLFSIFIAFVLFGVLISFDQMLKVDTSGGDRRLVVLNKISYTEPLPVSYVAEVRRLNGVDAVSYASWLLSFYQRRTNPVVVYAVEPSSFLDLQSDDIAVAPARRDAFVKDRVGLLVSDNTAKKLGLRVGQNIALSSLAVFKTDGSQSWTFHIDGIYHAKSSRDDGLALYMHAEYLNEARLTGKDTVDMIWVRSSPGRNLDAVASQIDNLFANSPVETKTSSASEFAKAFIAQLGNVTLVITLVTSAAFITILLIVANTMSMAFRERTRELAVLKSLGFSSARLFRLMVGEALFVSLLGGIPGLLVAHAAVTGLRLSGSTIFQKIDMPGSVFVLGLIAMVLLAGLGSLLPALRAASVRPSVALGKV